MSVDESTVILGPIYQVGWANASLHRDRTELLGRQAAERPSRGGEEQPGHGAGAVDRGQALVERAVLGVDRDDLGAGVRRAFAPPAPRR